MKKIGLLLLLLPGISLATDDCKGHSCNGADTVVNANSPVSVSSTVSDTSRAFGLGLGDVDINDCYRSYQVLIFQDSRANLWCMANDLDARGLHDAAARVRCSLNVYSKNFDSKETCIAASTVQVIVPVAEDQVDEDEEEHKRELDMELALLRSEFEQKFEQAQARPAPAPRVVERVIEQKPLLSQEQIDALRIKK